MCAIYCGVSQLTHRELGEINSAVSPEKWPLAFELLNNCGGAQREGYIGFQDHGDDVWFRNIRIKVLD